MSFSDLEIQKCALALGYGLTENDVGPVRRAMNSATEVGEELIRTELQSWEKFHNDIQTTAPFAAATFRSGPTGSQQYNPGLRMHALYRQSRHHIAQLAVMLNLAVYRDIYDKGRRMNGRVVRA